MSQFDLPRINFHGTALLDTATANNGNYEGQGLTMFDQNESKAFMPPRCYLKPNYTYQPPPGVEILHDNRGAYVQISPVTIDNYQEWATAPLGSFGTDHLYYTLYSYLGLTGQNPGYWNYFGDMSITMIASTVTGITLAYPAQRPVTFTLDDHENCPPFFANMFGAQLSFNKDFFTPGSRTSAYFCDVDSIGQMCTQIFCGEAGLYKTEAGQQTTLLKGHPVKSYSRWMNLTKVLNYADHSLLPMGGSACFYAMLELQDGDELLQTYQQFTGKLPQGLFLKFMIHEVHEVREPSYAALDGKQIVDIFGNNAAIPTNPARASISGSITPYYAGDMKTGSMSRLLKNDNQVSIDTSRIPKPVTKGGKQLGVPDKVNLAPITLVHQPNLNLVSLDIMSAINEYGLDPGTLPDFAGSGDIPPFEHFESYKFGDFTLSFQPDHGGQTSDLGNFTFGEDYQMSRLLATGGMVDIPVHPGADFSGGTFFITLYGTTVFREDQYHITSDQMGNYAQEGQADYNYMINGLPKGPCLLRVFYRGQPFKDPGGLKVTRQAINMRTGDMVNTPDVPVYDGMQLDFDVKKEGCLTYGFIDASAQIWDGTMPHLFRYVMNTSLIVVRTLSSESHLADHLSGQIPITWDIVFNQVFALYKVLYPVMDRILPFNEANWSDPFLLRKLLWLTAEDSWDQPLYMPVTRDLSDPQRQLLQMWAEQLLAQRDSSEP